MRIQHARVRLAISMNISGVSVTAASYIIGHSMEVRGGLHGGSWRSPWRSAETSMEVRGGSMEAPWNGPPWRLMELGGDLHEPSQTSP